VITSSFARGLAELIHMIIYVYTLIIIVRALISWAGNIPPNTFTYTLGRLTDPVFRWVHRYLPFTIIGGIDISPLIILIALHLIDNLVYNALINWSIRLALGT
jgi:YggT family protein